MALLNKSRAAQQQAGGQQSYLTPQMAQLLSQQGVIPQQISGIDKQLSDVARRGDVGLPQSRQSPGGWTTAPHWTEALSHVAAKTQEGFERRGLQKTRDKKAQELADNRRDMAIAQAEAEAKKQAELVEHREATLKRQEKRDELLDAQNEAQREATEAYRDLQRADTETNRKRMQANYETTQERLGALAKTAATTRLNDQVRRLGQEHSDSVRIGENIRILDDALEPIMQKGGNIPGVGFFEGATGGFGNVIRAGLDYTKGGNEAQSMYAKIRGVLNPLLRADAGTAQTLTETRNILAQLGMGGDIDEEVFIENYPAIRNAYNADMKRLQNTYDPAAISLYEDRFETSPFQSLEGFQGRDAAPKTMDSGGDVPRFVQDEQGNYTVQ